MARPRRQVAMTVNTPSATSRGSHPPRATLDRLAARKVTSTPPKATAASSTFQSGHFHSTRPTSSSSSVSTTSAPVTDTPYAVASRADERNVSVTASTPTNRTALTPGR